MGWVQGAYRKGAGVGFTHEGGVQGANRRERCGRQTGGRDVRVQGAYRKEGCKVHAHRREKRRVHKGGKGAGCT